MWTGEQASRRTVNVTWTDIDSLAFILQLIKILVLRLGWFAVFVKQCLGHCQWLIMQNRQQVLQL
jgi:uncharacterized membrane protein YczE